MALALAALAATVLAQEAGREAAGAELDWPRTDEHLLLVYTRLDDAMRVPDRKPLLRIYGDGRVLVHRAAHMKRAGDWEGRLDAAELDALVNRLQELGVVEFDAAEVQAQLEASERARRARDGTLFAVSDTTLTVLELHAGAAAPGSSETAKRRIEWPNVPFAAERHPEVAALQGLAAAERELLELVERLELRKVGS